MRLLTHNQLICIKKGCAQNYPLKVVPTEVEQEESEVNPAFIVRLLNSLDYSVLYDVATNALGLDTLPEALPEMKEDEPEHEALIQALHTVLLDTHVLAGELQCNKCGRSYPIQQGIPNMRLNEDEVA
mmetsp:Transcript_23909/g.26537  ORF Transcript_23909/g.26537 Transcript_23909/m.26537 type:complete len:128 (+) Transcript_23909:79-462(+)|eukprot:CAMPEP_0205825882 /NCGR_PEP_ID=MMETSP0206-20130828/26758_1 /ASSEMBLY_ACC=CAM_ASM_000279 /TAXON_ID=36767 /ORGANISM="Euplotes focardii, Strain TN1" /LENGTH=127 /DNA_ID=CAMNT_0053125295 /DNA_START=78 /DNA_END=461 /DNA_ORIENTATION=+